VSERRVLVRPDATGAVIAVEVGDGTRRNALREGDWRTLAESVTAAGADEAVRVLVISGRGATFSAGSDMTEWADAEPAVVERSFATMEACFRAIEECPVPVIAAVEGVAAGAGCQLALACDLVLMGESARIGMPIARLGILTSVDFAARVSARSGAALAADLYLTGRLLSAPEALVAGLVARVAPDGQVVRQARDLAGGMVAEPPAAVRAAKLAVRAVTGAVPRPAATRPPQTRRLGAPEPMGAPAGETATPAVAFDEFRVAVRRFLATRRHPA